MAQPNEIEVDLNTVVNQLLQRFQKDNFAIELIKEKSREFNERINAIKRKIYIFDNDQTNNKPYRVLFSMYLFGWKSETIRKLNNFSNIKAYITKDVMYDYKYVYKAFYEKFRLNKNSKPDTILDEIVCMHILWKYFSFKIAIEKMTNEKPPIQIGLLNIRQQFDNAIEIYNNYNTILAVVLNDNIIQNLSRTALGIMGYILMYIRFNITGDQFLFTIYNNKPSDVNIILNGNEDMTLASFNIIIDSHGLTFEKFIIWSLELMPWKTEIITEFWNYLFKSNFTLNENERIKLFGYICKEVTRNNDVRDGVLNYINSLIIAKATTTTNQRTETRAKNEENEDENEDDEEKKKRTRESIEKEFDDLGRKVKSSSELVGIPTDDNKRMVVNVSDVAKKN